MGCFSCFKSSNASKKRLKCQKVKPSNEEETSRKRRRGLCCFNGGKPLKVEQLLNDEGMSQKKESKGCFMCKRSPKDDNLSKKKENCRMCCFRCKDSSKDEGYPRKERKSGMWCFHGKESLKDEDSSMKKAKCGMCCFGADNRPLSKERTVRRKEGCTGCFHGGKPKKEKPREEKEKATSCCACAKPSDGKPSKHRCTKLADCSCGCWCWSASAHKEENKNKTGGKGMLCWKRKEKEDQLATLVKEMSFQSDSGKHRSAATEILRIGNGNIAARVFTYRELSLATQNFASESLLGNGGFGKVYKGHLDDTNQDIAVKKLDRNGFQGNREFLIEVLMLSLLSHKNLVTLLGYCADGDERILVYEYMPNRSVHDQLFDLPSGRKPLNWKSRMKIALGAAKGLEHLHDAANPPVIFRDLKASNILIDNDFNPKLADFGLAKLGPTGPRNHVSTRVMGTFGYCAPEYVLTGKLTMMSDIYSFGVVLLELITGRKAMDRSRLRNEQILVEWAKPLFKDKRNFVGMADPLLEGKYPVKALYQAVAVAAMCLQDEDTTRPLIKDVVTALQYLTMTNSRSSAIESEIISSEGPEQLAMMSFGGNAPDEKEPRHSSDSDWQSCSTAREDDEVFELDAYITGLNNADPQET